MRGWKGRIRQLTAGMGAFTAALALVVDGAETGPERDNLAVKAAELVLGILRADFGVRMQLEKRIPVGAGLGGGSADGAAALQAVNALAGNPIPRHELFQLAARLGSDVPFCFSGASLALGWGRGERLMALPALPRADPHVSPADRPDRRAPIQLARRSLPATALPPAGVRVPVGLPGRRRGRDARRHQAAAPVGGDGRSRPRPS